MGSDNLTDSLLIMDPSLKNQKKNPSSVPPPSDFGSLQDSIELIKQEWQKKKKSDTMVATSAPCSRPPKGSMEKTPRRIPGIHSSPYRYLDSPPYRSNGNGRGSSQNTSQQIPRSQSLHSLARIMPVRIPVREEPIH